DVEHFTMGQFDIDFRIGNGGDPETWPQLQVERTVTLRRRAGVGGSDRYTFTWPDGVIRNAWLRVRVAASQSNGLLVPDVFYFGNLPGETGNSPGTFTVSPSDVARVRARLGDARAPIDSPFDFDRDGRVNARDLLTARGAAGQSLQPPPRELTATPSAPGRLAEGKSAFSGTDDLTSFDNPGPSRALRCLFG
ncbi:MAG TPA: hypothetical protein VFB66_31855, partial [Tepidisphaeraceae bacterium]|nr:hypothetical protein [Tepidisphaeraceae bacterium]